MSFFDDGYDPKVVDPPPADNPGNPFATGSLDDLFKNDPGHGEADSNLVGTPSYAGFRIPHFSLPADFPGGPSGSFGGGADDYQSSTPSSQEGFPARITTDQVPSGVNIGDSVNHGFENFWGSIKLLPGIGQLVTGLGDALAPIGRSLEGTAPANAAGAAIDTAGAAFGLVAQSPVLGGILQGAAGLALTAKNRAGAVADQLGTGAFEIGAAKTAFKDGRIGLSDFLGTFVDSLIADVSSPFVGSLWRDADLNRHPDQKGWGNTAMGANGIPQDLIDSAEILSAIGAGKVVKLGLSAFGASTVMQAPIRALTSGAGLASKAADRVVPKFIQEFAYGFQRSARALEGSKFFGSEAVSMSSKLGTASGATVATMTGLGAAEQLALEVTGQQDSALGRSILGNRFGPEDAKWRLPLELATTWPMDVFEFAHFASEARIAGWARDGMLGAPNPAITKFYGGEKAMADLVAAGHTTPELLRNEYRYAQRQYASEQLEAEALSRFDAKLAGWTDEDLKLPGAEGRLRIEAVEKFHPTKNEFEDALNSKLSQLGQDRGFDDKVHAMMERDAAAAGLKTAEDRAINFREYQGNFGVLTRADDSMVLSRRGAINSRELTDAQTSAQELVDRGALNQTSFDSLLRDNPTLGAALRRHYGVATWDDLSVGNKFGGDPNLLPKRLGEMADRYRKVEETEPDRLVELMRGAGATGAADPLVQRAADQYMARNGYARTARTAAVKVDPAVNKVIANDYEAMKSVKGISPKKGEVETVYAQRVRAQYKALIKEVNSQWHAMTGKDGVTVEPWRQAGQPYKSSAELRADVTTNKHLWVFEGSAPHDILTAEQNYRFRAVHDYFGHAKNGFEFGPNGIENAWVEHSKMFSSKAVGAMTTETRGLASWATEHPKGTAATVETGKAGLLPTKHWQRNDLVNLDDLAQAASAPLSPENIARQQIARLNAERYAVEAGKGTRAVADIESDIAKVKAERLNTISLARAALDAKDLQTFAMAFDNPTGSRAVKAMLNAMSGRMAEAKAALSAEELTLNLIGTRWQVAKSGRLSSELRLTDDLGKDVTLGHRKAMGRAYDAVFGGVSNSELRTEWFNKTYEEGNKRGLTSVRVDQFFMKLEKTVEDGLSTGGYKVFNTIRSLDKSKINEIGKAVFGTDAPRGMRSWTQFLDYHHPGPIPHAIARATGKEIHFPGWLADVNHQVIAHWYPFFRFTMDPRWRIMNMFEKPIVGATRGGLGALLKEGSPEASQLAKLMGEKDAADLGVSNSNIIGQRVTAERMGAYLDHTWADDAARAHFEALMKEPSSKVLIQHYGTEREAFKAVQQNFLETGRALAFQTGATKAITALETDIKALEKSLAGGHVTDPASILEKSAKLDDMKQLHAQTIVKRDASVVAAKALVDENKLAHPVYSMVAASRVQTLRDLQHIFEGSPTRSEAQRVMNSYLLYWPLSYQFRVAKELAKVLTSEFAGVHSGMAPFAAYAHMRSQHDAKFASDPEYQKFWKEHQAALQLFEQLLPITPEGLGVTLGAPTRIGLHLAQGRFDSVRDLERLYHVGPILTASIIDRILTKEAKRLSTKPTGLNEATLGQ